MARSYAPIDCAIWLDKHFCSLTAGAQRTYFMLISQTDIAACGTLPLTVRRWSSTVAMDDPGDLGAWLGELSQERFVIIDEDTEELLVRSFVRWDGGYKHAKRILAVKATAQAIRSEPIRNGLAIELHSIGITDCLPIPNGLPIEVGRVVVTEVGKYPQPTTLNPEPDSTTLNPGEGSHSVEPESPPRRNGFCKKHQPDGTDESCHACKRERLAFEREQAELREAELAAAFKVAEAIVNCTRCDDAGLTDTTPARRCTHQPEESR